MKRKNQWRFVNDIFSSKNRKPRFSHYNNYRYLGIPNYELFSKLATIPLVNNVIHQDCCNYICSNFSWDWDRINTKGVIDYRDNIDGNRKMFVFFCHCGKQIKVNEGYM